MPFEDHYNGAITKTLGSFRDFRVSTPLSPIAGKVDIFVALPNKKTCAIETIMAERTQVCVYLYVCFNLIKK